MRRIALFGGTFDPVHTDHINIAKACVENLGFDEVWMIPNYLSPFKKSTNSSIKDRLAMLEIVRQKYDFIRINEYEIRKQERSFTYETVKYLKFQPQYKDFEFSFIMGSDQLDDFENWDHFPELIKLINFKVFLRSEFYNKKIVEKYNLEVFEFNNNHLSSTKIRNLQDVYLQDPEINEYINKNLLYLNERLAQKMDEKRFQHCLNVGVMARHLAKINNLDQNKAWVAGTLHDVTKRWTQEEHFNYLKKWMPPMISEPFPVWHSFTGYLHLQKDWQIQDVEILQAVFNHTVASLEMSPLDMVVFCADKVSIERDYPGVEQLRSLVEKDLLQGFKTILKNQYDNALKKNGHDKIGSILEAAYQHWIMND
ncbi:nicotinate-nucleotide adenylyltransferase [Spiroplasma alleghenense]|uniref:Probable nicotinate-nucleotide adenylyltransferase n=1 Tax=Spiroplasma alleghenense TaxID=216931 RepID=A0A345Z3R4_9MOLU|nr:nicotinate-nucleotide adenylyltransferase [Spiroplasma alleghenense]AXK51243.1 nicotinic acid mononucleotide adenylyltransferase [Spiroplasma alleghenense]